ncbi:hypothetical protein NLJ89_g5274 [Agrocybe chaxingu]|uniref:Uncharacterized protein n=1 Tax=Agrocybe chaxingu TaxID=84603 RepID=A0A9W8K8I6_9AGAR|nr:hypothetical protein NLJ89_g5274 [Agrocybe chaxingu]
MFHRLYHENLSRMLRESRQPTISLPYPLASKKFSAPSKATPTMPSSYSICQSRQPNSMLGVLADPAKPHVVTGEVVELSLWRLA